MPSTIRNQRRYDNIRAAMREQRVDALIVCGNQYAGFEGAVFYTSGFEIVHRYVYVLIPLKGDPVLVFPQEARWIGDKKKPFVQEKVWADIPGRWLRERAQDESWKRVAVYGLDYVMAVRDYRELQQGAFELVPFDFHFDMARAVKSEEELAEDPRLDGHHPRGLLGAAGGLRARQDRGRDHGARSRDFLRARRRAAHDEHRALGRERRSRGALQGSGTSPRGRA